MPYQGYDPSKYIKDYSWIGNMGNAVAQFAYRLPELVEANKAIHTNANANQETVAEREEWIKTVLSNDQLRVLLSQNYGTDPEHVEEVLRSKFRDPKEREDSTSYHSDAVKRMTDIINHNKHNISPELFMVAAQRAMPGTTEEAGQHIHERAEREKNILSINAIEDWFNSGITEESTQYATDAPDDGSTKKSTKRTPTTQELMAKINQAGLNVREFKHLVEKTTQTEEYDRFVAEIRADESFNEKSFTELYTQYAGRFPDQLDGLVRNLLLDMKIDKMAEEDANAIIVADEKTTVERIKQFDDNRARGIQMVTGLQTACRNRIASAEQKLAKATDGKAKTTLSNQIKKDELLLKVYDSAYKKILQSDTAPRDVAGQAIDRATREELLAIKKELEDKWTSGGFQKNNWFVFPRGFKGDANALKKEAELLGLEVSIDPKNKTVLIKLRDDGGSYQPMFGGGTPDRNYSVDSNELETDLGATGAMSPQQSGDEALVSPDAIRQKKIQDLIAKAGRPGI